MLSDGFTSWLDEKINNLKEDKYDDGVITRVLEVIKKLDVKTLYDFVELLNLIIQFSTLATLEAVKSVYIRLQKQ